MKNLYKSLVLLSFIFIQACGGSSGGGGGGSDTGGVALDFSNLGTKREIFFTFGTQLTDPSSGVPVSYDLPDMLASDIYIQSNGNVKIAAQDFPRIVVRICSSDNTGPECDTTLTGDDFKDIKVDLVIDSCGKNLSDSSCGAKDPTVFSGTLSKDGSLQIIAVAMRVRAFLVDDSGDSPDGFTAEDTDSGIFSGRIIAQITTGTAGSATGEKVNNKAFKMVSAGVVPASFPEQMAGFSYLATMTGSFDQDPLALIQ